jgi:hypothetical protein
MSGVILVVPNSYFASTDASGAFTLSALPPGSYSIAAWHERSRTPVPETLQRVSVSGGAAPITFTLDLARSARGRRVRDGATSDRVVVAAAPPLQDLLPFSILIVTVLLATLC